MKRIAFAISFTLILLGISPANSAPAPEFDNKLVLELRLIDNEGNEFTLSGTHGKIQEEINKLQEESIALAATLTLGDNCRISICYKTVVDVSTGQSSIVPFTEEEIQFREASISKRAIQVNSFLQSIGEDFLIKTEPVFAIPINAGGFSTTIQGTLQDISRQVDELKARAENLRNSIDTCMIETCYKTIVDLHWGMAPATTTTIPLTEEDLAQRALDRSRQIEQADALASAAATRLNEGASPVYSLSVSTTNRGFGTTGTREQLIQVVNELQARAAQARQNAEQLASGPIIERGVVVDLHWGLSPATTTEYEREITGAERDQRIADANRRAQEDLELASAAEKALSEIP